MLKVVACMTMSWTLVMLALGLLMVGISRWYEGRPHEIGEVRLFPAAMVLAVGLVFAVLALAHLASLIFGLPTAARSTS